MRRVALALAVIVVALAATAAADTPKIQSSKQALRTLHTVLSDALKLERNALEQSKAGDETAAHSELGNASSLIASAQPAAEFMTAPPLALLRGKDDPWEHFDEDIQDIASLD